MGDGKLVTALAWLAFGIVHREEPGYGLLLEPLPHVALIGSGAHREFGGRRTPVVGERTVEAEPAADVN
jgi:hypothetical protein